MSEKSKENTGRNRTALCAPELSGGAARSLHRDEVTAALDPKGVEILGGVPGSSSVSGPVSERVVYELYSGHVNFPDALTKSADEFVKDMNEWAEPIMKDLAGRNAVRARYDKSSMLGGYAWSFNLTPGKLAMLYTGVLSFDGAELDNPKLKGARQKMKDQKIRTQAEMNDSKDNDTCYGFNLPTMIKLKADDGTFYDVRVCVVSNHQSMNSQTPEGRGRLLTCGGLLNHACRKFSGMFKVVSHEQVLEDQAKHKTQNEKYMHSKSRTVHGENPEYSDESETSDSSPAKPTKKDGSCGETGKCDDSDDLIEDETDETPFEVNSYSFLVNNDLIRAFLDDGVFDEYGNYLPGMLCMILSTKNCFIGDEFTLDYGHTTTAINITSNTDYRLTAFWTPARSVNAKFRVECLKDETFAEKYEIIVCQCQARELQSETCGNGKKEVLEQDEKNDVKDFRVDELDTKCQCPANVARIAPKESPEELRVRKLNEAYLIRYTVAKDQSNAARDTATLEFLIETENNLALRGPLLGHYGFPADMNVYLNNTVKSANERLGGFMDELNKAHAIFGIGRHESVLPDNQLVHFNGGSEIPEGTLINITVGVLFRKEIVPLNVLPNTFDLPDTYIGGYDVCIVLLRCNPTPRDDLGWCSIGAFPNGCDVNVHLIRGSDRFACLDDYFSEAFLERIRQPLSHENDLKAQDLIGLGISMSIIKPHSALVISKSLFSQTTDPMFRGNNVHEGIFIDGTFLHRCNCNYPGACPAWMFESVCALLNQYKLAKQPSIRAEEFRDEIDSLNPHTLCSSSVRFSMSEDEKQLHSRLRVQREKGDATYTLGPNSILSPNRGGYAGMSAGSSKIISQRPEVVLLCGSKAPPQLHGENVSMAPRTARRIIPSVTQVRGVDPDDKSSHDRSPVYDTESESDRDEKVVDQTTDELENQDENDESGESSVIEVMGDPIQSSHPETPETGKHKRADETTPPDAPIRKAAASDIPVHEADTNDSDSDVVCLDDSPVPKTPDRLGLHNSRNNAPSNQGIGEVVVYLVDSPEPAVAQIDEAGPPQPPVSVCGSAASSASPGPDQAFGGAAAGTSASGTRSNPDDDNDYVFGSPESPSDAQERYRREHGTDAAGEGTGAMGGIIDESPAVEKKQRRPRGARSESGKTKPELIDNYVTEANRIKELNNENYRTFMTKLNALKEDLNSAEAELDNSVKQRIAGSDAARRRMILRGNIEQLKETLEKLSAVKDDFDKALMSPSLYIRLKKDLNQHDARTLEKLISELPEYVFTYTISDSSEIVEMLSKIPGFGPPGEGGTGN
jgi:hypothetical protein